MRNQTQLGMSLGQMLSGVFGGDSESELKGKLDGWKARNYQSQIALDGANTEKARTETEQKRRELELGSDDSLGKIALLHSGIGTEGRSFDDFKKYQQTGYVPLVTSYADKMPDAAKVLASIKTGLATGDKSIDLQKITQGLQRNHLTAGLTPENAPQVALTTSAFDGKDPKGITEAAYMQEVANGATPERIKTLSQSVNIGDPEKAAPKTELEKLIIARDSLPQGSPDRAVYDNAIRKSSSHAPSSNTVVNMPKVETSARIEANTDFSKNVYRAVQDASKKNSATLAQLDALEGLPISEKTGWGTAAKAKAAEVLVGLGYSGQDARQYASDAQTFRSIVGRQVWEMLGQQKGPQTEGDAQRAQATYAQLGNTPQANKFINDMQRSILKRQNAEAKFYRDNYSRALNAGDLSQLERDWLASPQANKSLFEFPEMRKWAVNAPKNNPSQKKVIRYDNQGNQLP